MQISEQNISGREEIKIGVTTNLYKNGELVGSFNNSITNFSAFGARMFKASSPPGAFAYQVISTNHLNGNVLGAGTITKVSDGVYKSSFSTVFSGTDTTTYYWTGGWVQSANNASEAYKVAAGTWNIAFVEGDTLVQEFVFTFSGVGFTTLGINQLITRCLDAAGLTIFDDIALFYYGVERQRIAATYAEVSPTIHTLTFKPVFDDLANAFRLYYGTGEYYCYEKIFTQLRIYLPTYPEVIKITLSQA